MEHVNNFSVFSHDVFFLNVNHWINQPIVVEEEYDRPATKYKNIENQDIPVFTNFLL